jgi:hypothetical protein
MRKTWFAVVLAAGLLGPVPAGAQEGPQRDLPGFRGPELLVPGVIPIYIDAADYIALTPATQINLTIGMIDGLNLGLFVFSDVSVFCTGVSVGSIAALAHQRALNIPVSDRSRTPAVVVVAVAALDLGCSVM